MPHELARLVKRIEGGMTTDDLPDLLDRLAEARGRLVGELAREWPPENRLPEPGLVSQMADLQASLQAVDAATK